MKDKHEDLNETELIELCKKLGLLNAHRGWGRDVLVRVLNGDLDEGDQEPDPIDDDRDVMQYMMATYPDSTYSQLRCADESYFCPNCPTGRVVSCAVMELDPSLRRSMQTEMSLAQIRLRHE